MINKSFFTACILSASLLLQGCASNTTFGVPNDQWKTMNQQQRQAAIAKYNKEQKEHAKIEPLLSLIGSAASVAASDPSVRKHTTWGRGSTHTSPMSCHQNADGSEDCTQSSSGSHTSFGID